MRILVTGGAGYIGSHTAKLLDKRGSDFLILDNLCRGHEWAVKKYKWVKADLSDRVLLRQVLTENRVEAVIHFAAHSSVGESVQNPSLYYDNNVKNSMQLLELMNETNVKHIVFSSSAAVYGNPKVNPIPENYEKTPVNPYGETKVLVENALAEQGRSSGLRWMALRYFNAAGADPEGEIGEDHDPETHLIPLILKTALGKRPHVEIYGSDYPTPDGTPVRDYIHVTDLADAHIRALEYLKNGGKPAALNLGTGRGYSVKEVIRTVEKVTGRKVPTRMSGRRAGDPAALVAEVKNADRLLGWKPQFSDLETIVKTAWNWHKVHDNK